ncbi:unnamed protein product, partial [Brenthis ino]
MLIPSGKVFLLPSSKGTNPLLMCNGYTYKKQRVCLSGKVAWYCSNRYAGCKAYVDSMGPVYTPGPGKHNHPKPNYYNGNSIKESGSPLYQTLDFQDRASPILFDSFNKDDKEQYNESSIHLGLLTGIDADAVPDKKNIENVSEQNRKRKRNENMWKKNVSKKLRNEGKSYMSATRKIVPERNIKNSCSEKCKLQCSTKFTETERKSIFKSYCSDLNDFEGRPSFVITRTSLPPRIWTSRKKLLEMHQEINVRLQKHWCRKKSRRKQTKDERLLKKRLAEQRRYSRIRNDPQKWAEHKIKRHRTYMKHRIQNTTNFLNDANNYGYNENIDSKKLMLGVYLAPNENFSDSEDPHYY